MTLKKILAICTACLALIAILIAGTPFGLSLKPNARAESALPRIDISQIKFGELSLHKHPAWGDAGQGYSWSVLIIKLSDNSIKAWLVPSQNGRIGMPDRHWWRPIYPCKDFGLSTNSGSIDEQSDLRCHDKDTPYDWLLSRWQWDLNGKAIDSKAVEDMPIAVGAIKGKYFVLGKRS
ncbi:MAG: hypothetical protein V4812_18100 [Pseudomonadota bacterium]